MAVNEKKLPVETRKGSIEIPERIRALDKSEHFAVLATTDGGEPYASLVAYAFTPDLRTLIFATPRKTQKYRNIRASGRVALLIDSRSKKRKDLLGAEAMTVMGAARTVRRGPAWDGLAAVFLEKHPALKEFIGSPSTALVAVDLVRCVHVSAFQTVTVWECGAKG